MAAWLAKRLLLNEYKRLQLEADPHSADLSISPELHIAQAVVGAVFGAFLSGLLYQLTKKLWGALLGETIGTGFVSAMVAYPLMKFFYALDAQSPFYYIPFYLPASVVGGLMGCAVLLLLKRARVLDRMLEELNR